MNRMRVNERIAATRLMLILSNGQNNGETPRAVALDMARREGLDLVEVSPGTIPVCKICDFGKLQYEKSKQEKHHSHAPTMKEIRVSYLMGDHDLERQKAKAKDFLSHGHKVMLVMKAKGREKFCGHGAARDKFVALVQELVPTARITDLQESSKGYSYLLYPSK